MNLHQGQNLTTGLLMVNKLKVDDFSANQKQVAAVGGPKTLRPSKLGLTFSLLSPGTCRTS